MFVLLLTQTNQVFLRSQIQLQLQNLWVHGYQTDYRMHLGKIKKEHQ